MWRIVTPRLHCFKGQHLLTDFTHSHHSPKQTQAHFHHSHNGIHALVSHPSRLSNLFFVSMAFLLMYFLPLISVMHVPWQSITENLLMLELTNLLNLFSWFLVICGVLHLMFQMRVFSFIYLLWLTIQDILGCFPCNISLKLGLFFLNLRHMLSNNLRQKSNKYKLIGGGEFRPFSEILSKFGITHRITCPHAHTENGIIERKHRHIVDYGLALCFPACHQTHKHTSIIFH